MAVVVVVFGSFLRGSNFEMINIIKALSFVIVSMTLLSFFISYHAVRSAIKSGDIEDKGILFKK